MKFRCLCGEGIYDQTDVVPEKAYYVADQDREVMIETIEAAIDHYLQALVDPAALARWHAQIYPAPNTLNLSARTLMADRLWGTLSDYQRIFYQCSTCGRLWLWDRGQLTAFKPEYPDTSTTLLASVRPSDEPSGATADDPEPAQH